jgi:hypothetical protein
MENVKSIVVEEEDEEVSNSINFWESSPDEDSVSIVLNDDRIVVITDDSVRVRLGDRSIRIGDDGVQLNVRHKKRPQFDGHWDGFELVLNGLLNSDNKTEMPAGYENMDLNYGKSWGVNLNVWEQNFNLANQHLGLVTGLGISWNNYRFDKNVKLTMDNDLDKLVVTKENLEGVDYEKSKLVVSYLNVPLLLEYQTNAKSKSNSFHISGGVVGGLRIGSHTKRVYDDGSRQKDKDRDDFYLAPFKLDAVGKIGWGKINLVASYGITELFRENKGPQVYPFSIGICLTDF